MRFLKLLDPRSVTPFGPGLTIAEQARQAREMFPKLVSESRLSYWRPGEPIARSGTRFLVGLAPTFSLSDMRLADLLNESLKSKPPMDLVIDVFDADDVQEKSVAEFFPGLDRIATTPIVGIWENGRLQRVLSGADAMNFVLQDLGIPETANTLVKSVRPPPSDLLDD